MGGGEWLQQQTYECPECKQCVSRAEFYKYIQEVKAKGWKDKADLNIQVTGILWGWTTVIFAILIIGAIFSRDILAFAKGKKRIEIKR